MEDKKETKNARKIIVKNSKRKKEVLRKLKQKEKIRGRKRERGAVKYLHKKAEK